mmetsp:Transcript_136247/g.290981  ORF Transcript_136247/g.290981 Transcript_136247/m.290981 type:complete len:274 (+) Transcript_136247:460-1281(+)
MRKGHTEAIVIGHEISIPRNGVRRSDDVHFRVHRRELARAAVCLAIGHTALRCEVHARCDEKPGLVIAIGEPELMLEAHVKVLPQRHEVHIEEALRSLASALDCMSKVVDVARLREVYQDRLASFPRDQDESAREVLVKLHLLARQLLPAQKLLCCLQVDLDEGRLVQDVKGGRHGEVVTVVQQRNLVVGLPLQAPCPVVLTDMQLRRAPRPSHRGPRCSKADSDEAVQVPVVAKVRTKRLCLFNRAAQIRGTDGAQRPGIELMRQRVLVARQ